MNTILVHVSDRTWTMQAMHFACALARNTHAEIVLVQLLNVYNPGLLGAGFGAVPPSCREIEALAEFAEVAEDYGVPVSLLPMQYLSLLDALVQIVEQTGASALFAHVPQTVLPLWNKFQTWNFRRQLTSLGCQLCALEAPNAAEELSPALMMTPVE